ncbi:hypothetical protein [Pseudoduganella sp.]|uniref:hypothetical protein n=1 Tax=Pseudoduganella sp. TaxID=1880898 RepID=UPI0035B02D42
MRFPKSKWFAYTLLIGIIPMLARLLVWATTTSGHIEPIASADLIALGLVLHTSTINEIARLPERRRNWKTLHIGMAILLIAMYGALYTLALIGDNLEGIVSRSALLTSSLIVAGCSAYVSTLALSQLTK